jgi:hypothetical protein
VNPKALMLEAIALTWRGECGPGIPRITLEHPNWAHFDREVPDN